MALREIAEETVTPEDLREELIHTLQKYTEVDEPEPEAVPLIPSGLGRCRGRRRIRRTRMSPWTG